ncbi:MAG: hypothetical protein ACRENK_03705 [Gemmatimonadaceae bacterium]
MNKNLAVVLFLVLAAGCTTTSRDRAYAPPVKGGSMVSEQDCTRPLIDDGGNLYCRQISEEEQRARAAEEQRQATAKREAEERAERERIERERAEQLAREEAARKQRIAEEEAAAAAVALKARQEREAREKAEAEVLARQRAEQEAREAAARECRRLEQARNDGRMVLENFVTSYGTVDEFKGIAGQISAFLAKPRKEKLCPPA